MPFMMPGATYDPQQLMWLQHMYAQQMTAYMQYYQQPGYHGHTTASFPGFMDHQQGAAPQANPEIAANNPAAGQAPRPNQGAGVVRMNAGGGAVIDDDDDEEGVNRDWLDWLYTLSRVVVLFTIVYFYSTPTRFTLVIIFFFLFYLYQAGYLTIQRREPARRPQPEEAAPRVQQQAPDGAERPAEENGEEEETDASDSDPSEDTPPLPQSIHPLTIMWTFFFKFFTSLVPQAAPGVNAN